MSDFMDRARAEAWERWPLSDHPVMGREDLHALAEQEGFMAGAEWARDELLADPTDGEVWALGWIVAREALGLEADELFVYQIDAMRAAARAALAAFLSERRGSE